MDGLTVATPWYPTPYNRMAGSFVAAHARLAAGVLGRAGLDPQVRVVHGLEWPGGTPEAAATLRPAFDDVLDRLRRPGGLRLSGACGPVDRVPVFTVGGASWGERAQALVRDVQRGVGEFETSLVHGHVGYLGGLLAARLAAPGARVFATEHSTALRAVLDDPLSRDHYAELLDRATAVFCVSGLLRDQVMERVADPHGRLQVLPNPVDFAGAPRRSAPPQRLDRWVFVGGLHERKGVERLVRAFTVAAATDDQVTLTLFGDGALAGRLAELAADAGVGDRLHLAGTVPHRQVLDRLPEFDLLLAPSTYETFHLAVTEAVAAGVPVIVTRSGGPQESLAGVESQVGRFVDVEDSPDQLVDAWTELSQNLDTLDLDAARQTLDARYGVAAVAARLAAAYGLDGTAPSAESAPDEPARGELVHPVQSVASQRVLPQRLVILAVSGWRRYAVEAELAAAHGLGGTTVVVTADPQIAGWAAPAPVVAPSAVPVGHADDGTAQRYQPPAQPLAVRARRAAGALRRRLNGSQAPVVRAAGSVLGDGFLDGATLLVGDCQSMPLAQQLLAAHPGLLPVVELDRGGPVGSPPDGPDDSSGSSGEGGR